MASTDFMTLVNRVLRKLNEVELSASTFDDCRGVHAAAKDAINDAIDEINKVHWEWPFNAVLHSQDLSIGNEEYAWPTSVSFKSVDWDSFQIQKDDTLNTRSRRLKAINKAEWYQYLKDRDDDAGMTGLGIPMYVLPTHGTGFAVSPSPDQDYAIQYRYYKNAVRLEDATDVSTVPADFDYVIIQGALHAMYMFLDNDQRAQVAERKFLTGVDKMRLVMIPEDFHAHGPAMNTGGDNRSGGFYWGEGGF